MQKETAPSFVRASQKASVAHKRKDQTLCRPDLCEKHSETPAASVPSGLVCPPARSTPAPHALKKKKKSACTSACVSPLSACTAKRAAARARPPFGALGNTEQCSALRNGTEQCRAVHRETDNAEKKVHRERKCAALVLQGPFKRISGDQVLERTPSGASSPPGPFACSQSESLRTKRSDLGLGACTTKRERHRESPAQKGVWA